MEKEPKLFDVEEFAHEFLAEEGKMDGQSAKKAIYKFAQVL